MHDPMTRRSALAGGAGLLGATGLLGVAGSAIGQEPKKQGGHAAMMTAGGPVMKLLGESVDKEGKYTLPALPYDYAALEPSIDAATMKLHHDKHHAKYVADANEALAKLAAVRDGKGEPTTVADLTEKLAFNVSGHLLHSVFWAVMGPKGGSPEGAIAADIDKNFGSFEKFKLHFTAAAMQVQGNGWAVLALETISQKLIILNPRNHQVNVIWSAIPLLVLDVWEHAYYLKYNNLRADYVKAFSNVINWPAVDQWYGLIKKTHHEV